MKLSVVVRYAMCYLNPNMPDPPFSPKDNSVETQSIKDYDYCELSAVLEDIRKGKIKNCDIKRKFTKKYSVRLTEYHYNNIEPLDTVYCDSFEEASALKSKMMLDDDVEQVLLDEGFINIETGEFEED